MLDSMLDRDAIEAALAGFDDDGPAMMARLNAELSRQMQARWLDENIPALGGLTPRQAAADPTQREQIERLLAEFDRIDARKHDDGTDDAPGGDFGGMVIYDTDALRRELGLT